MIPTRHRYCALIDKGLIAVALGYGLLHAGTASAQTPTINLLLPSSTNAGGPAFTLTVTGTGYNTSSVVQWNGSARVTSFFSSGTLEAQITSDDIATPGQVNVTVVNPGPPGVTSEAAVFTIKALLPTITNINPTTVVAGGTAFTLTVTGTNYTATSVVLWNGSARPTTFVNSTTLTAAIPASDISQNGVATITVTDPASGGTPSNAVTITIASVTLYFPQVALGGGYSTVFTIFGTAGGTVLCTLTLTDQAGNPLVANISSATIGPGSLSPTDRAELSTGPYPFYLFPGGMRVLTVTAANPADPLKVGWASVGYQGGTVYGVATFKYRPAGTLISSVGILSSQPINYASIPVDNDDSQGRYTGFAIANPSSNSVNIRLITLDQNGNVADNVFPPPLNPLGPNSQVSRFLHEIVPQRTTFKGTMILYVQSGQAVMSALVLEQGVLSAIPVVPDKVAGVP